MEKTIDFFMIKLLFGECYNKYPKAKFSNNFNMAVRILVYSDYNN